MTQISVLQTMVSGPLAIVPLWPETAENELYKKEIKLPYLCLITYALNN
jgi:hypothetical protein